MDVSSMNRALEKLFGAGETKQYKKHAVIVQPDIPPEGVYFIRKGFVKSYDIDNVGRYNLLVIMKAGGIFPFEWAMHQPAPPLYYEAATDVTLNLLSREDFLAPIERSRQLTEACLQWALLQLWAYSRRILDLALPTVLQRLASRLLYLAEAFGRTTPEGILLDLPLTYTDLAESINTSRETVNRGIHKLKEHHLISIDHRRIYVRSKPSLEELINTGVNDVDHISEPAPDVT